jgi:hypothetical protein
MDDHWRRVLNPARKLVEFFVARVPGNAGNGRFALSSGAVEWVLRWPPDLGRNQI